jgi:hypothetical protein
MSTATRRATSRKAMRVATVFTGAAATAVAFAPAALAAPSHAPAQGHTALVNGKTRAMRPDVDSGTIRSKGCGTSDVHWLHIEYVSLFRRDLCKAFGYRGFMTVAQDFFAECGGNNYGTIYWNGGNLGFGPGNTYRSVTERNISGVSIYSFKGTDKCAWPR